jgi:phytoene/squalene synthetase
VSEQQAFAGFLDKWRARWPEWGVAEVFVPASQREIAAAWFALQQELTDAAWAGRDPRPGEAKVAWWAEELRGWSQGRRRHPLGIALQRWPAPWLPLAASLPILIASREPASDWEQAVDALEPFAQSAAGVSVTLFTAKAQTPTACVAAGLLAQQVLLRGDAAAPLRIRAQVGDAVPEHATARAWAGLLLQRWPDVEPDSRPDRIFAALLRERLRRAAAGGPLSQPLPRLVALWTAWRAARG